MSTDRELLELAAKANGFQVKGWIGDRLSFFDPILDSAEYEWNPLTDDGDALRLAVALEIEVVMYRYDACGDDLQVEAESRRYACQESTEENGGDKFAACRRAIVRAAAEIGRSMP
ncbi:MULTISPECIES: hypothetical protein [unclassified Pseudomonas]|uniref:hypothetical protein n=1 Tax=unclassified Pseudomonas TaxID=196821 RepID=UPI00235F28E7|nr:MULTISPECIES: hypothetical protein [unclassified Pseudomonas]